MGQRAWRACASKRAPAAGGTILHVMPPSRARLSSLYCRVARRVGRVLYDAFCKTPVRLLRAAARGPAMPSPSQPFFYHHYPAAFRTFTRCCHYYLLPPAHLSPALLFLLLLFSLLLVCRLSLRLPTLPSVCIMLPYSLSRSCAGRWGCGGWTFSITAHADDRDRTGRLPPWFLPGSSLFKFLFAVLWFPVALKGAGFSW